MHWHRMHDETFFVTKGRIRFTTDKTIVDAKAGDYVVVPVRAVHAFSSTFLISLLIRVLIWISLRMKR